MTRYIHRMSMQIRFPEGVRPGEGRSGNLLTVALDGMRRPVLRGSSLTGALRHAWTGLTGDEDPEEWFGSGAGEGTESPLRVADVVLEHGHGDVTVRTHIARSRHSGAVLAGGLVEIEAVAPGSSGLALLVLESDRDDAKAFLLQLAGIVASGLTLGGSAGRGIGRVEIAGETRYRRVDLSDVEEHANWLDECADWRARKVLATGDIVPPTPLAKVLDVRLRLQVPRGQDLVVGDGQGLDREIEPQRVLDAGGKMRWRLPGASLRGALRAWVSRLAAREGKPVADSVAQFRAHPDAKGSDLAFGFMPEEARRRVSDDLADDPAILETLVPCPVMRLFGSGFSKGRIHVSDGLATYDPASEQVRRHVAVDRLTGGASEGFLFDDAVVTRATWDVSLTVHEPTADEARWLASSIRAIHMGIVRIGSSKAGGRLALAERPRVSGPCSEAFADLDVGGRA